MRKIYDIYEVYLVYYSYVYRNVPGRNIKFTLNIFLIHFNQVIFQLLHSHQHKRIYRRIGHKHTHTRSTAIAKFWIYIRLFARTSIFRDDAPQTARSEQITTDNFFIS